MYFNLLGHCSEGYEQEDGRKVPQEERCCRGTMN